MCWAESCTHSQTVLHVVVKRQFCWVISNSLYWSWSYWLRTATPNDSRYYISTIVETVTRLLTYQRWCSDMTAANGWQRQRLVNVFTYLFITYRYLACYQVYCQLCTSYDKTKTDKELWVEKILKSVWKLWSKFVEKTKITVAAKLACSSKPECRAQRLTEW